MVRLDPDALLARIRAVAERLLPAAAAVQHEADAGGLAHAIARRLTEACAARAA